MQATKQRKFVSFLARKLEVSSKHNAFHQASTRPMSSQVASKPYEDIPTKKGILPAALDLLRSGGPGYLHEHCDRRHAELGPIFRERLGSTELVFIADTKMIQTVIANEGSQPHHNVPEAWILYNRVKNIERGLFFQVGEPWLKLRRAFNKVLLADASRTTRFASDILTINSDLFNVWQRTAEITRDRRTPSMDFIVQDIKFELCKWSIEATGLMLFGCRMGCIQGDKSTALSTERADLLVKSVADMFAETSNFQVLPCNLARRLKLAAWSRFESASDNMIDLANEYAVEFIAKARDSNGNQSMVKDLLDLGALDDGEISRSMVDLIIAAADTTSNSLQWMLYILAKHEPIQANIWQEIRALGDDDIEAFQNIRQSCPYLCAFVKEVSRLYPTAPFLARTLERDISLNGYTLPACVTIVFSLYTTSRMSEYFEEPLEFKPERWLRNEQHNNVSQSQTKQVKSSSSHAFASLPFGVGARMCIGRRMAELEMHLLIASFVRRYTASLADQSDSDIGVKLKMILCPDKPIKLRLKLRNAQDCM